MRKTSFFSRNAFYIFLAAIFLLPIALRGARFSVERTKNDVKEWLPAGFEETKMLGWFRQYFVGEQFVVMSWRGCTLDDPRVEQLARTLESPTEKYAAAVNRYIKTVTTGPRVLEQMTDPHGKLKISREEALRRLGGSLVGRDGQTTCVLVTLTEESIDEFRKVLGRSRPLTAALMNREDGLLFKIADDCGIQKSDLIMGGPPVDNVAIDDEGEITLLRLVGLSCLLGLCLSYYCFRSRSVTAMVFCCGVFGAIMSLGMVYYLGGTCDAVLMSMPSLVYVLGLSGAIHLVNYYKDAVREFGVEGAPEAAVRHGWLPCTLAAVTTALGLGSLLMSEIVPIQKFGKFSAIGVMFTLVVVLTLLPTFLEMWPLKEKRKKKSAANGVTEQPSGGKWFDRMMGSCDWIIRRHGLVSIGCSVLMVALAIGITRIETSVHLLKLFAPEVDIIEDYAWLEANVGNLVPMEVVLRVDPERMRKSDEPLMSDAGRFRMTFLERMEMVGKIQKSIERLPEVGRALSIVAFAPQLPDEATGIGAFAERSAFNGRLQNNREEFLKEDYYRTADDGQELFRVSARLAALSNVDYGQFVDEIRAVVQPVLSAYQLRDEILEKITADGEPLSRKRICIIGVPRPGEAGEAADQPISPSELTAETLVNLLRVARVRVKPVHKAAADYVPKNLIAASDENKKAANFFGSFDLIFVASDHPSVAHGFIRRHARRLVDARSGQDGAIDVQTMKTAGISPVYTGVVPLVYKAQRTLLSGLVNSTGLAFVLICVVMILILRSPLAGLLSMIPNVFPVLVIFGGMGWLGIYVDIGTMMCASVAMGVAVDDTVHYLTWFRRGILSGLDRRAAVRLAYERCATAMIQTTIIGGLGLAVFMLSTFTPTRRFGLLMLILLSAALVGDLIFLPALLAGPIGRFFTRRLQKQAEVQRATSPEIPTPHFVPQGSPADVREPSIQNFDPRV
ncbi:MAG: MMPL family transporter [Pirellulales bacterium]